MNIKSTINIINSIILLIGSNLSIAALIDRGNGLIYDDDLNITWMADANYAFTSGYDADGLMTYQEAEIWVNQLEFGGYNDWRLTNALPSASTPYCNSSYNCTDTELAHLYYFELDGVTINDKGRTVRNNRTGNYGPFTNIQYQYWSGLVINSTQTMNFHFDAGFQVTHPNANLFSGWAVRNGDVSAVPIPAAAWLFGSGLFGLVGFFRYQRNKLL